MKPLEKERVQRSPIKSGNVHPLFMKSKPYDRSIEWWVRPLAIPEFQKDQRAGCVGRVFLVVDLEIQGFGGDGKFKLLMPCIRSRYLQAA
jgi:hypothetical protein